MTNIRLNRSLEHAVPAAANVIYGRDNEVFVWPEDQGNNCIGEWVGPHFDDGWDHQKRLVYVQDRKYGPSRPFNLAQVKRYLHAHIPSHSHILEMTKGLLRLSHVSNTNMTEILHPDDPRAKSEKMINTVLEGVKSLIKLGVFKFIQKQAVSYKANILSCNLFLHIKVEENEDEQYKDRLVIVHCYLC